MRVTEGIMEVGEFDFALRPETPRSVRDEVVAAVENLDGFVVVFDAPVTVPTLGQAVCPPLRPRVASYGAGVWSFRGIGLAGLLQDNNDLGKHTASNVLYGGSQNLSDWYTDLLPFAGITKGTVTTTGLSSLQGTWHMGLGLREMIDFVTAAAGGVWRINNDGTIDAAAPDTLFGTTPTVLITPNPSTEAGGGIVGIRGGIDTLSIDASQVTKRAIGYGAGDGDQIEVSTSTNAGTLARGLDGAAMQIDRPLEMPNSTGSELSSLTAAAAARFDEPRKVFSVATYTSGVRSRIAPGDQVYIYDLDAGIVDPANFATVGGEGVQPLAVRVQRITWTTHAGQGVFLYRPNEASPWTDLSVYMPETGGPSQSTAQLTVSTELGAGDLVKTVGANRYFVRRPESTPTPPPPPPPPDEPWNNSSGGSGGMPR